MSTKYTLQTKYKTICVEQYSGLFTMDIGKYKTLPEVIVAIIDKSYYEWYLENIKYPKNICYHISDAIYNDLYK